MVSSDYSKKTRCDMKQKNGFSGQIGFVFAAAGSAVGVGNLWRFPYLAAKDGGGLFLVIYLILVLTFGFTLLTTDIAIGRKTGKSAIYGVRQLLYLVYFFSIFRGLWLDLYAVDSSDRV